MKIEKTVWALFLTILLLSSSVLAQEKYPRYLVAAIDDANVRTDSTINSEIIIKLNKGDVVVTTKDFYDWYKIVLPKYAACYVSARYISAASEKSGTANSDNVNIRLRPDTKSPILGKLKQGEPVNIINFSNDWYAIEPTENTYGWIHKSVVRPAENTNRLN
ncbi:MAG: SH3 domain-containing protein [Candidatus Omnitrophica bacterium]|nr:SH3 domain-containing protein [Candidatus Omnitrophota bacterium]